MTPAPSLGWGSFLPATDPCAQAASATARGSPPPLPGRMAVRPAVPRLSAPTVTTEARRRRLRVAARRARVGRGHIQQLVPVDRLLQHRAVDLALAGELGEHGEDDRLGVDVEEATGRAAGVGEAEAVRAER